MPSRRLIPRKIWTVRELADWVGIGGLGPLLVGGPQTVADLLEEWIAETDVDGFNLAYAVTHETFTDIAAHLVPELQRRGVYKRDYAAGTLREKLFGAGPRLPASHPGARYRDLPAMARHPFFPRPSEPDTARVLHMNNLDLPPAASETDVLWFLPTHGDGRYLGSEIGARHVSLPYLSQIARAADDLGYFGVLLPTGRSCEDSWVIASAMVPLTERLRFLVAVRPGLQEPAVAARMTATLDRISNGRLLVNVVTGGDPLEAKGDGIFMDHGERYAVTDEFLHIYRQLLRLEPTTYEGKHLRILDGSLLYPPVQTPYPPLYFGGSSDVGMQVAAEHVDTYLTWGEPPDRRGREDRGRQGRGGAAGPQLLLRHPPPRHRARNLEGGLGARPTTSSSMSTTRRSRRRRRPSRATIRSASSGWRGCTPAAATSWRSAPTSGPASASCAAAPARRWSATPMRSRSA